MNRLKEVREARGKKQQELASLLKVSQGTLSNWERGVHDPDNEMLFRLSKIFDVTTDYLLGLSDVPKVARKAQPTKDSKYDFLIQYQELDDKDLEVLNHMAESMLERKRLRENSKG